MLDRLVQAVEAALGEMGIRAPLMIVRGDGSPMNAATAREKPIETVLSGPAASMVGGVHLTGQGDAIVVDIGGTTSDLGVVKKGKPKVNPDGAVIGGWRTRVRAADIHTIGLGGDSEIWLSRKGALEIGPRRAMPLSFMGCQDSGVEEELRIIAQDPG
ncbi:MAG: hydantoinase/oxoprolinase family protein [Bacillota bacterium]